MPYSYKRSRKDPSPQKAKGSFFEKDSTSRAFFKPSAPPIQTKLTIGKPDDAFEREADAVADRVVNQPAMGKPVYSERMNTGLFWEKAIAFPDSSTLDNLVGRLVRLNLTSASS